MTVSSQRPSIVPAVIGFGLGGLLILVVGLWTASRRAVPAVVPRITLLQPSRDTTISGDLILRFTSTLTLSQQTAGWGAGRHHLHALVNGTEVMPAPADVARTGPNEYAWTIRAIPDSARVQLIWALPNHRRLTAGASQTVQIRRQ